jgi:Spy/CpxP family protein refolding chaperone
VNDWKIIPTIVIVTALIFGAGVFTGGLLVNEVQKTHPKPAHKPPANAEARPVATNTLATTNEPSKLRPPEILSKKFLQQLDTELSLKPAEREAISKIIDDGQNQMRKTMQDARLEIREVLTPEQRVQFDDLVKRPFHKPIFATNAPTATPPTNPPAATP